MTRIVSRLPEDRAKPGVLLVLDEYDRVVFGPAKCYGKSDSAAAAKHSNPARESGLPYGDHPYGEWTVTRVVEIRDEDSAKRRSYGPFFIGVDPVMDPGDGVSDAERRAMNGGNGIGLHGGDPAENGGFRPTYGCLRLSNSDDAALAGYTSVGMRYTCERKPESENTPRRPVWSIWPFGS